MPPDVGKIVSDNSDSPRPTQGELSPKTDSKRTDRLLKTDSKEHKSKADSKEKPLLGFSLVAGYGDDSEEEDEVAPSPNSPLAITLSFPNNPPLAGHSTLFPIAAPIDPKQFDSVKAETTKDGSMEPKAFQRKRRIGIDLVNVPKKPREDGSPRLGFGFKSAGGDSSEHPGCGKDKLENVKSEYLGFKSAGFEIPGQGSKSELAGQSASESKDGSGDGTTNSVSDGSGNGYLGFKSGGVLFGKEDASPQRKDETLIKDIEESRETLKEKLDFLNEGRDEASPVQVMIIQLEVGSNKE